MLLRTILRNGYVPVIRQAIETVDNDMVEWITKHMKMQQNYSKMPYVKIYGNNNNITSMIMSQVDATIDIMHDRPNINKYGLYKPIYKLIRNPEINIYVVQRSWFRYDRQTLQTNYLTLLDEFEHDGVARDIANNDNLLTLINMDQYPHKSDYDIIGDYIRDYKPYNDAEFMKQMSK